MARFLTRIELHDALRPSYDELHKYMEEEGFSRTISSADETYHLPTAEYRIEIDLTLKQVLDMARKAANRTGKKFGVITVLYSESMWWGLDEVK